MENMCARPEVEGANMDPMMVNCSIIPDKRVPEKGPLFFGKPLCASNAINARC